MSALAPFGRTPSLENSKFYMGSLITFLVNGDETAGAYSLVSLASKAGNEPPPHFHAYEHETWYILEGRVEFFWEGAESSSLADAGSSVFLPCGVAHAASYRTPEVRFLLVTQSAGEHAVGLDTYFQEVAHPATSMTLPDHAVTYSTGGPEELSRVMEIGAATGTILLSEQETATRLPSYPGFAKNL